MNYTYCRHSTLSEYLKSLAQWKRIILQIIISALMEILAYWTFEASGVQKPPQHPCIKKHLIWKLKLHNPLISVHQVYLYVYIFLAFTFHGNRTRDLDVGSIMLYPQSNTFKGWRKNKRCWFSYILLQTTLSYMTLWSTAVSLKWPLTLY